MRSQPVLRVWGASAESLPVKQAGGGAQAPGHPGAGERRGLGAHGRAADGGQRRRQHCLHFDPARRLTAALPSCAVQASCRGVAYRLTRTAPAHACTPAYPAHACTPADGITNTVACAWDIRPFLKHTYTRHSTGHSRVLLSIASLSCPPLLRSHMTSALQPPQTCQAGERGCCRPNESTLTRHYRRAQQCSLVVLTQGHAMARPSGSNPCVDTKHMHARTSFLHMLLAANLRQIAPRRTIARATPPWAARRPAPLPHVAPASANQGGAGKSYTPPLPCTAKASCLMHH